MTRETSAGVSVATHFARPLARALRARDLRPEKVLGVLSGKEIPNRVPYEVAAAAWTSAVEATGDDAIGLAAARQLVAGDYGLLEYLTRSSATLRVAVERLCTYQRLMNDRAQARLSVRGGQARLRYLGPEMLAMPRAYLEFVLATWVKVAREMAEDVGVVAAVHLPHPPPRTRKPYLDSFGRTVVFASRHAEIVLDAKALERPLVTADAHLTEMLEQHARSVLAAASPASVWRERVAEALRPRLADGTPRLETIATDLAVNPRALRRRLDEEGATFSGIVDDLRHALALEMVRDASLSLGEIAFLLGFSEASAFHRAFRRWTGRTPRG